MKLPIEDYSFNLPAERIAQIPQEKRDESKLLILDRKNNTLKHDIFKNICSYFSSGDCLVINKTRVFPARVAAKKATGGKVELLFVRELARSRWSVLTRDKIQKSRIIFGDNKASAIVSGKDVSGEFVLEFDDGISVKNIIKQFGEMPTPPYIKRNTDCTEFKKKDFERYQTVYASNTGSIAAPTAGLHFTDELLNEAKNKGVNIAEIVLHVGWGTFKPISTKDITEHKMLPESYFVDQSQADIINIAKRLNKRIIAVGTTSVRTLETLADNNGEINHDSGETGLFITPGYKFKCIDIMLTNFHTPQSTPLALVCALAGRDKIFNAYNEAIKNNYRFYSYGDAMLII